MDIKELKELQKEANRYIKIGNKAVKSGTADSYTERAYYNAQDRLRRFQLKHSQRKGYMFSMKNLSEDDYDTYEQILRSVTENTRLNPEKAKAHKESQINFYQEQGWATNRESAEAMYNFKNSDVFEQLMEKNLGDIPSEILDRYGQFIDADYDKEDFAKMITVFEREIQKGSGMYDSYQDFVNFTDRYIEDMRDRPDDFKKAVDYYLDYDADEWSSFFEFLMNY